MQGSQFKLLDSPAERYFIRRRGFGIVDDPRVVIIDRKQGGSKTPGILLTRLKYCL
jgi:hypothetical protein